MALGRFLQKLFGGARSDRPHELDRADDPRGGHQSDDYRNADPRDVVDDRGAVMMGPGGAPQEGLSADERRERDEPGAPE